MISEPLPCPFCGSAPQIMARSGAHGTRVRCANLSCAIVAVSIPPLLWNRRPEPTPEPPKPEETPDD